MSVRKKYAYSKDLKIYSFLKPPVFEPALPFVQLCMKFFYHTDFCEKDMKKETEKIPVKDGAKIRMLIYTPEAVIPEKFPCIIFYHGGGFVYNAAPHHFTLAKNLARKLGVKVFFIDYRLAPAHPFPTAAEDAYYSYRYIYENAEHYGIDRNRIALCGDSAGGNLSAVTCLIARDRDFPLPKAQVLLYPFVDGDTETESMLEFTDTPMCNSKAAVGYNKAYIKEENKYPAEWFSVVDAESLENLPEAYIETAQFDCLRDGGVKYYNRLCQSGVKATLFQTKGTMHGYDIATGSAVYALCMDKRTEFLRRVFEDKETV